MPTSASNPPSVGHNSNLNKTTSDQLRSFVERVERLEDEKKQIAGDIGDVLTEAASNGFDKKAIKTIVRIRRQDKAKREEEQAVLETYMHALGMIADLPLGQAAIARDLGKPAADVSAQPFRG